MRKIIAIIIFIFYLSSFPSSSFAATAASVQQQITDTNTQIQALDNEIAKYKKQISETSAQAGTLTNLIKELTLSRNKLTKEKDQAQKKIDATNLTIGILDTNIQSEQQAIESGKISLSKMISDLYKQDQIAIVQRLLTVNNFADASREYNNTLAVNESVRQRIIDLKSKEDQLNSSKTQKVAEKQNLTDLKKVLAEKEQAVLIAKTEKANLLKETKNKESNYEKILAENQKRRDSFEQALANYETQLKFILNPNLLPSSGSGVLAWPLDNVYITQLFGKTVAAKRLYVSGSHSGVDFRASIGTPVKSMGHGTVIGTGDTDNYCRGASFGKWIFIRYDNGLSSTFGHLSLIYANSGQEVNTGDVVALSGNTGHSTGPHLHVTVYASQGATVRTVPSLSCSGKTFSMPIAPVNAYLDPMLYFPKISNSLIKADIIKD